MRSTNLWRIPQCCFTSSCRIKVLPCATLCKTFFSKTNLIYLCQMTVSPCICFVIMGLDCSQIWSRVLDLLWRILSWKIVKKSLVTWKRIYKFWEAKFSRLCWRVGYTNSMNLLKSHEIFKSYVLQTFCWFATLWNKPNEQALEIYYIRIILYSYSDM